jgi:hypothetical protein
MVYLVDIAAILSGSYIFLSLSLVDSLSADDNDDDGLISWGNPWNSDLSRTVNLTTIYPGPYIDVIAGFFVSCSFCPPVITPIIEIDNNT